MPKKTTQPKAVSTLSQLEQVTNLLIDTHTIKEIFERMGKIITDRLHSKRWSIMMKTDLDMIGISLAQGIPEQIISETKVKIGEGIAGKIFQDAQGGLYNNIVKDLGMSSGGIYGSPSAICIPITLRGEVLGVLNINEKSPDGTCVDIFTEEDFALALIIANQAAMMIDMVRSIKRIEDNLPIPDRIFSQPKQNKSLITQASAFDLLSRVIDLMTANSNLDQILSSTIKGTSELLGATRISLMLLDQEKGDLRIKAAIGMNQDLVKKVRVPLGVGIAGNVAKTGTPQLLQNAKKIRIGDASKDDPERRDYRINSALSVPLKIQGKVLGVLNINDPYDSDEFSDNDLYIAGIIAGQAAVAISNARLLEESVSAAEMRRSMEVANEIQNHLLPTPFDIRGLEISSFSDTCEAAGGDYVDYFNANDLSGKSVNGLYISCGDVSGHGVGAALIMAMGRAFLRALLQEEKELATVMARLNNLIETDTPHEQFMTLFLGHIDIDEGQLTYSSAGHEPGLLYRFANDEMIELPATGLPLGMFPDQYYSASTVHLHKDDLLLLSTDGLAEAMDNQGHCYGRQQLIDDLRQCAHLSPKSLIAELKKRVNAFIHPQTLRDDLSLIVAKVLARHT